MSKKAWTIFPRIGLNSRSGMLSKFSFLQRGQRQSEGDGEEGEALIDSTPYFHSNHGKIERFWIKTFFLLRLRASLCSGIFTGLWEALGMMSDFRVFPGKKASNRAQQGDPAVHPPLSFVLSLCWAFLLSMIYKANKPRNNPRKERSSGSLELSQGAQFPAQAPRTGTRTTATLPGGIPKTEIKAGSDEKFVRSAPAPGPLPLCVFPWNICKATLQEHGWGWLGRTFRIPALDWHLGAAKGEMLVLGLECGPGTGTGIATGWELPWGRDCSGMGIPMGLELSWGWDCSGMGIPMGLESLWDWNFRT